MTEQASRRAQFPIRTAAQICRLRFQECTGQASLREGHWAQNCSSDFNLWDSGVGACANELNCLDKRLEHDVSAQKVVIGALSTLAAWTTKCIELAKMVEPATESLNGSSGSSPSSANEQGTGVSDELTLYEAKDFVTGLLRVLVDLEIAIRRAGTASRMRRADRTFYKRKDHYADLSREFEFILRVSRAPRLRHPSIASGTASAQTDEIDVGSALSQIQGDQAPLRPEQQILLLANVRRADRFKFYKGRKEHLQSQQAPKPMQTWVELPVLQASSPSVKNTEQLIQSPQGLPAAFVAPTKSQYSTGTTNQASDYTPSLSLEKAIEMKSPGIAATTIALRASYPNPPKDKTKCPYCLIPFKGEADDMRLWRNHVSEDLQPYTCYLPDCSQNLPFFNTFEAWETHVLSGQHQKLEGWTCLFCQVSFKSAHEHLFLNHIQEQHSDAISKQSLTDFVKMCGQFKTPALDRCPVCSIYENDWKLRKDNDPHFDPQVKSFLEHLGQCIHNFTLRALPETEPVESMNESHVNVTNISPNEDRSWPSCSLHISYHTDSGLGEADLEESLEFGRLDRITTTQMVQKWVDLAQNMKNPNSLDIDESDNESDNELNGYKVRKNPERFFMFGKVFKVLWHQPAGTVIDGRGSQGGPRTNTALSKPIYSSLRWMMVVTAKKGYCICCPISTYANKGLKYKKLHEAEIRAHAIVYASGTRPCVLKGEPMMTKEPIKIHMVGDEGLNAASRVNFAKCHTVEYNVKVMELGQVDKDDEARVASYFMRELQSSLSDI